MSSPQWWPLDSVRVTGEWGNSPAYYAQFGQRGHNGIDLAASLGTPVYATDGGVVHMEGWNLSWTGAAGGIAAIIRHAWGYSGYAHLSSTVVNAGQSVMKGQLIGYSGSTGVGTGPHLHFETFPPNINFQNGFAGRVNPSTIITLQARNSEAAKPQPVPQPKPKPKKDKNMYLVWDTNGAGYLVTPEGARGLASPQVYNLFYRIINSDQLRTPFQAYVGGFVSNSSPGNPETFNKAEMDVINYNLTLFEASKQSGVTLDIEKTSAALSEALGKKFDPSVELDVEDLAAAFETATPRIVAAMLKQSGAAIAKAGE